MNITRSDRPTIQAAEPRHRRRLRTATIFGIALLSAGWVLTACSSTENAVDPQAFQRPAHQATATSSSTLPTHSSPHKNTASPLPQIEVKTTQVHMQFTNNTGQTLNLSSSSRSGTNAHWETQPPTTLAPKATGYASSYSSTNAQIELTYTGATDNAVFTLVGLTSSATSNFSSSSSSSSSYTVSHSIGTGFNPTATFIINAGATFNYNGQAQQYVVPVGVTQLAVDVIGGSGGDHSTSANGAQIGGTLAVTPGQVLTIGVGGAGQGDDNYGAGWGLPFNGSSFAGGQGVSTDVDGGGGGGGASVIIANNQIQVVAGGGGGEGNNADHLAAGGQGGYNGQLIGQNGQAGGGQAGNQSTYTGQDTTAVGTAAGGAGGGGYNGGAAATPSSNGGGGAGSSYDAGLTNPTVTTASGGSQNGKIILVSQG